MLPLTRLILAAALGGMSCMNGTTFTIKRVTVNPREEKIFITARPTNDHVIFHDTLNVSSNSPHVQLSSVTTEPQPTPFFDKSTKETRQVHQGPVVIQVTATTTEDTNTLPTELFVHYMTSEVKGPQEQRFLLHEVPAVSSDDPSVAALVAPAAQTAAPLVPVTTQKSFSQLAYDSVHRFFAYSTERVVAVKSFISHLFTSAESRAMQFLMAFLLGILMSLTPCIYPMIPVTVGLLGTGNHNSVWRNFLLASSYTVGLATTFAVMGLVATLFGTQFGQILSNPIFVIGLVTILGYLGGSMLGWYEMRIPRFLQPREQSVQRGSFLSAFIFGVGTGTIASPCMSPGLALVLTVVNKIVAASAVLYGGTSWYDGLLGFFLLFVFGLGSSLPLLIIGTFSSSLHVLPRAGMWMVEVKKVFGFMLFGMCLYYLSNILPTVAFQLCTALFFGVIASYYFVQASKARTFMGKCFCYIVSATLFTTALYTGYQTYQAITETEEVSAWRTDYEAARLQAQSEQKMLLLDFGASWCSLCKSLERNVLNAPEFRSVLNNVVAVKIDGTASGAEPYTSLVARHAIIGLPTVLLIDPTTDTVIGRWDAGVMQQPLAQFVSEITQLLRPQPQQS